MRMLVMKQDQSHPDPYMDAGRYKRGDVVVAVEDGHEFSAMEHADFVVVDCPGIPAASAAALVGREVRSAEHQLVRRRGFAFDLDGHDGKRVTVAKLKALHKAKPVLRDPDVLG